jgi:hypothetical protein
MITAGRRSVQGHGLTRHIQRVKGCWSARASTVAALSHSLFARSAPRRLAVRLVPSGLMASPARVNGGANPRKSGGRRRENLVHNVSSFGAFAKSSVDLTSHSIEFCINCIPSSCVKRFR